MAGGVAVGIVVGSVRVCGRAGGGGRRGGKGGGRGCVAFLVAEEDDEEEGVWTGVDVVAVGRFWGRVGSGRSSASLVLLSFSRLSSGEGDDGGGGAFDPRIISMRSATMLRSMRQVICDLISCSSSIAIADSSEVRVEECGIGVTGTSAAGDLGLDSAGLVDPFGSGLTESGRS